MPRTTTTTPEAVSKTLDAAWCAAAHVNCACFVCALQVSLSMVKCWRQPSENLPMVAEITKSWRLTLLPRLPTRSL